jgi:hypothetical protein
MYPDFRAFWVVGHQMKGKVVYMCRFDIVTDYLLVASGVVCLVVC